MLPKLSLVLLGTYSVLAQIPVSADARDYLRTELKPSGDDSFSELGERLVDDELVFPNEPHLDTTEIIPRKHSHSAAARRSLKMSGHEGDSNFASSLIQKSTLRTGNEADNGHTAYTVNEFPGAPSCVINPRDVYSCATTADDQIILKAHLDRRSVVAFLLTVSLCVYIWLAKWIFHVRAWGNLRIGGIFLSDY